MRDLALRAATAATVLFASALAPTYAVALPQQEPAASEVQERPAAAPRFPSSSPLSEGVSPEGVDRLEQLVQSFVDADEIVGAELLVVVNGKSILHRAFGQSDREAKAPMETGSVFCVRSMTKPLIGTAIMMLAEDKKLKLDDPVAAYIPALDVDAWRGVTLEHLLRHGSGLPYSLIAGSDLDELGSIQKVAALGATYPLAFEAGTAFEYSDQGTDTLTAVIEIASRMPAEEFIRSRILEPLGMGESTSEMSLGHGLRGRALPKYLGSAGEWQRFWGPDEPPFFPFFLGSQGLYATLEDYAGFMALWRRNGRTDGRRLLKRRHVREALTPSPWPVRSATGFTGVSVGYGRLMQVWSRQDEEAGTELVAFGHSGSDGTHAWVFPEQNAMVMYFTQSRGNPTGIRVEEALDNLFLGAPFDPNEAAPPLEQFVGYYQQDEADLHRTIIREGNGLALEVRSRGVVPLVYAGGDRFKFRDNPSRVVEFDRSPEGQVVGFRLAGEIEKRFEPADGLPTVDELLKRVAQAHRIDLLESLGPMRLTSTVHIEKLGRSGTTSGLYAWPNKFRVDNEMASTTEHVSFDGETLRHGSSLKPVEVVTGARGDAMRNDHLFARLGDLRAWHPKLTVVERSERAGEVIYLLRTGDLSGPASTIYVHRESGRVQMVDSFVYIEGMGRVGQRQKFLDYQEVEGVLLPHRTEIDLRNPLVGLITGTVTDVTFGVEIPDGTFDR